MNRTLEFFNTSAAEAGHMDQEDELNGFRSKFSFPQKNGKPVHYFTGNSLGLQPAEARLRVEEELNKWAAYGVDGHFEGERPWLTYHELSKAGLAELTGAKASEVVAMNNLTSNLHLMMVTFFRPSSKRFKIIMEASAFPSDQYAVESQLRFHELDPDEALVEVKPRDGEFILHDEDIIDAIETHGEETALVLFSGVQYFTGQKFDIKGITAAAHKVGAFAGFDLAHAIGNVSLNLHDDGADFAVWCTYKYLNSGPGSVSGIFVHEKHGENPHLPRFAGWWGYDQSRRFMMEKGFIPMKGADGWQLSNVNILGTAAHLGSLEVFREAGWSRLKEKSRRLTGYLEYLLKDTLKSNKAFQIITPSDPERRGCQLSLFFPKYGREVFDYLTENGVVVDWREDHLSGEKKHRPGVVRVAPVPLYTSFEDVHRFWVLLNQALIQIYGPSEE